MKCPHDNSELSKTYVEKSEIHFCEKCGGILLAFTEFPTLLKAIEKNDISFAKQLGTEHSVTMDNTALCPIDTAHIMVFQKLKNSYAHLCIKHQCAWVDGSSVEAMIYSDRIGNDRDKSEKIPSMKNRGAISKYAYLPDIVEGIVVVLSDFF